VPPCLPPHRINLRSYNGFMDELAFAAAMLYKATGEEQYKADAERYFDQAEYSNTQEVGALKPLTAVLMAQLDPSNDKYFAEARRYFDEYLEGNVKHTDCGSAQPYHWGGLTHGSNVGEQPAAPEPHAAPPLQLAATFEAAAAFLPCAAACHPRTRTIVSPALLRACTLPAATLGFCHAKNPALDREYAARLFNYGERAGLAGQRPSQCWQGRRPTQEPGRAPCRERV
jgi:hypothetical protein